MKSKITKYFIFKNKFNIYNIVREFFMIDEFTSNYLRIFKFNN